MPDCPVTKGRKIGGSKEEKKETRWIGLKVWDLFFFLLIYFCAKVVNI